MTSRSLKQKADAGELVLCLALVQARTPEIPIMAAACGFDAVYVDLEHTPASLETASLLCSAALGAGLVPLVRVPSHDPQYMTRVLDMGALGVIVPHVNTPAEAQRIVDTCRFPPVGHRSIGGPNPATGYRPLKPTELMERLERDTLLCVMLETPEAIANADAIAAVEGIDMCLVGTHDLTAEMGILGQFRHPLFAEAMAAAAAACRKRGKMLGVAGIRDLELLRELVAQGLRFISAGTDAGFFMEAATAHAAKLRVLPV